MGVCCFFKGWFAVVIVEDFCLRNMGWGNGEVGGGVMRLEEDGGWERCRRGGGEVLVGKVMGGWVVGEEVRGVMGVRN